MIALKTVTNAMRSNKQVVAAKGTFERALNAGSSKLASAGQSAVSGIKKSISTASTISKRAAQNLTRVSNKGLNRQLGAVGNIQNLKKNAFD